MLVGLHLCRDRTVAPFQARCEAILKHNDIDTCWMHAGSPTFWQDIRDVDYFIFRFSVYDEERQISSAIIPVIERQLHKKCFPNTATIWTYDDKVKQYFQTQVLGLPMAESWVFYDKQTALQWTASMPRPVVFKLAGGAGSTNVVLVHSARGARQMITRMFGSGMVSGRMPSWRTVYWKEFFRRGRFRELAGRTCKWFRGVDTRLRWQVHKNYAVFQKFLPNNEYDTRVTVIGDRAFAFRRMNRHNDFRSSGSGQIDYCVDKIDMQFVELSFDATKKLNVQSMAFDWLYGENAKPSFCEMSYAYLSSAVAKCPGYWDSNLNWHEGSFWPEYCVLKDLLGVPDLKQPNSLAV